MKILFNGEFLDSYILEKWMCPQDRAYVQVLKERILVLEEQIRELTNTKNER